MRCKTNKCLVQSRCSENVCSPSYFFYMQLPVILVPSKNVLLPLRTLGGSSSMISLAFAALVGLVSGTSYLKPKERIKKYQGMRSDGKHIKTQNRQQVILANGQDFILAVFLVPHSLNSSLNPRKNKTGRKHRCILPKLFFFNIF